MTRLTIGAPIRIGEDGLAYPAAWGTVQEDERVIGIVSCMNENRQPTPESIWVRLFDEKRMGMQEETRIYRLGDGIFLEDGSCKGLETDDSLSEALESYLELSR